MSKALVKLVVLGAVFVAGAVYLNAVERKALVAAAVEKARKTHAALTQAGAPAQELMDYNNTISLTISGGCPHYLMSVNQVKSQRVNELMMKLRRS
jgi:hypothetical protein